MQKRNTNERRQSIAHLLTTHREVSVEYLSSHFETSVVTIRKDLSALEENGVLIRTHGGAISLPSDLNKDESKQIFSRQKAAIAAKASELVENKSRIIIDSGSTTNALVPHLKDHQGLVILTNCLSTANTIVEHEVAHNLIMPGGTWDHHSGSFQGQMAQNTLKSFDFDQLFIGADGVDIERGSTTFNELISLSQTMAAVSSQVILMVELAKIGRRIPNVELPWTQIDILITNPGLKPEIHQAIESQNVQIICADE